MEGHWNSGRSDLAWNCVFVLPFWLQTVRRRLGGRGEPYIVSVADGSRVVGIAPLAIDGDTACFAGHPDVCDYQDIVSIPGSEAVVMAAVASHLKAQGIRRMDLETLHPDSAALGAMRHLAKQNNWDLEVQAGDVTYETALPADWEAYLMQMSGKQRHEVRRKLRRLENHGDTRYRLAGSEETVEKATDQFLRLFHMNRADKSEFMSDTMSAYFRDLIHALAQRQMLRLYFLDIAGTPAAAVLCFDYNQVRYLYNSAYDADCRELSVGISSKVLSIQAAVEDGCRHYDFLKGAETYKKHLGGEQTPLYRCLLTL